MKKIEDLEISDIATDGDYYAQVTSVKGCKIYKSLGDIDSVGSYEIMNATEVSDLSNYLDI